MTLMDHAIAWCEEQGIEFDYERWAEYAFSDFR